MLITCSSCLTKHDITYWPVSMHLCCTNCSKKLSFSPEKPKAETEGRVRIAQIKLRGDDGPSGELSPPEKFLQVGDKFYDYKGIQSVPAYHAGQLEFCDE